MGTTRIALVSALGAVIILSACRSAHITTQGSATPTPTAVATETLSPTTTVAATPMMPTPTSEPSSPATLSPTSRSVGFTFVSFEGEVTGPNGLRPLDYACVQVVSTGCTVSAELVTDDQGPMLWLAQRNFAVSVPQFRVTRSWVAPALRSGQQLHFAENPGLVVAIVQGTSDATFHWPDIVAAWKVDTTTGAISSIPTTGVSVLDACAKDAAQHGKTLAWCA